MDKHTCSDGGVVVSTELESEGLDGGGELKGLLEGLAVFDLDGVAVLELGRVGSVSLVLFPSSSSSSSSFVATTVPSTLTTS